MLAILSSNDIQVTSKDISFIHVVCTDESDIEIEAKPFALALARKLNLKKVYLFYGEKGKIVYEFAF